jgi:ADP-ribose pyrophosphatase
MKVSVVSRRTEFECPWLAVEAKEISFDGAVPSTYYSVRTRDYMAVLAVTDAGTIPLVRQYRPALEVRSLELPAGLVESSETPEDAARRELLEETGCQAGAMELLGALDLDAGRMQTKQWSFFAPDARIVTDRLTGEEEDLEVLFVSPDELDALVREGEFRMAAHLAVLGAAYARGLLA